MVTLEVDPENLLRYFKINVTLDFDDEFVADSALSFRPVVWCPLIRDWVFEFVLNLNTYQPSIF